MARKTKRKPAARRPARAVPAPAAPSGGVAAPAARPDGAAPPRRSVEMSLAPAASTRARGPARLALEGSDPGIPLDRVPYFTSDLLKLAAVAGAMIVLLVLGALFVIPLIVR